jgi:hypothetical protein
MASPTRRTSASASTCRRRPGSLSSTATGPPGTGRPTSASTGWPRRSSPPSRRACSRRASAGPARTARCGAGAGRGVTGRFVRDPAPPRRPFLDGASHAGAGSWGVSRRSRSLRGLGSAAGGPERPDQRRGAVVLRRRWR